ncbi:MAG: YbbC/YhhH family protein [Prevotella sp.]|nr:YbbC/YhhH family protein [Prevotella sp.]
METIDYSTKRKRSIYVSILVLILACGIVKSSQSQRAKRDGVYGRSHTQEHIYIGTDSVSTIRRFVPDYGCVPDLKVTKVPIIQTHKMAAEIGIAILTSLYGDEISEMQKPYMVSMINDEIWDIRGSLPYDEFYVMIQQSDCMVLSIKGYSYVDYMKANAFSLRHILHDIIDNITFIKKNMEGNLLSDIAVNTLIIRPYVQYIDKGGVWKENLSLVRLQCKECEYIDGEKKSIACYERLVDNGYSQDSTVRSLPCGILQTYETAGKIGLMILSSIYGDKNMLEQLPLEVSLVNDNYWRLSGRLSKDHLGGTAHMNIQKADCRIINYWHEK